MSDTSKIKYRYIKNSDYLASFTGSIVNEQNFFIEKYNLSTIHSRALEPFYIVSENEKPWTHYLKNKKVLIINPFVESVITFEIL